MEFKNVGTNFEISSVFCHALISLATENIRIKSSSVYSCWESNLIKLLDKPVKIIVNIKKIPHSGNEFTNTNLRNSAMSRLTQRTVESSAFYFRNSNYTL